MSETYKMTKWELVDGNTVYINPKTKENMKTILIFIRDSKKPSYTYSQLSEELGIARHQIRYSVFLLVFAKNPRLKMKASNYGNRVCTQVSFKKSKK